MAQGMKPEQLSEAIIEGLRTYTSDVQNKVAKAVKDATKTAYEEITELSPVRKKVPKSGVIMVRRNGRKVPAADNLQPGAYKKGWISTVRNYTDSNRTQGYVRNKTNYPLVHLLELGHENKMDGSMVKAIPHVKPGQDKGREQLDKDIKKILE
ncbi:MAG: hypothetical protein IJ035_09515 [Oscillospiraceae bacterium]|nr:hypothetical protein [Oscillospiraceae bacterium]